MVEYAFFIVIFFYSWYGFIIVEIYYIHEKDRS